jgi:hypothetical protein
MRIKGKGLESGLPETRKSLKTLAISPMRLADSWASQSASLPALEGGLSKEPGDLLLGAPLSIRTVAQLLGCSAWTVRQKHVPCGLPYFRSGSNGKLVFFRDQVIAWVLQQQKKGGRK